MRLLIDLGVILRTKPSSDLLDDEAGESDVFDILASWT
jgi:hypothetical protein